MAITCQWEKPLGTCYSEYDEEKKNLLTIYGGGNCLAVICDKNKNLVNFAIDEKHFKDCKWQGTEYTDITIFTERTSQALKLIKCLVGANFPFTVKRREK